MDLQQFIHELLKNERDKEIFKVLWQNHPHQEILKTIYHELFNQEMVNEDVYLEKAKEMEQVTQASSASKAQRDNEEYLEKQVSLIRK